MSKKANKKYAFITDPRRVTGHGKVKSEVQAPDGLAIEYSDKTTVFWVDAQNYAVYNCHGRKTFSCGVFAFG